MGAIIQGAGPSELRWNAQRLEISLSRQVFGEMWDTLVAWLTDAWRSRSFFTWTQPAMTVRGEESDAPRWKVHPLDVLSGLFFLLKVSANHELVQLWAVIERAGLCGYFLVVWDIVRYAREQGVRCQGRGSAANSLVAYLLGITPVDPLRHNLLFERFLSEGSQTMPDIDIDFAADRREEVIQYIYERYGEAHVGMVCNVVTYRARSALRDAAKALDTRSTEVAASEIEHALMGARSAGGEDLPWQVLAKVLREMEGRSACWSIERLRSLAMTTVGNA